MYRPTGSGRDLYLQGGQCRVHRTGALYRSSGVVSAARISISKVLPSVRLILFLKPLHKLTSTRTNITIFYFFCFIYSLLYLLSSFFYHPVFSCVLYFIVQLDN